MNDGVWGDFSLTLRTSAPFRALLADPGEGARAAVRLPTPAAAWVAELLAAEHQRTILVVVPGELDALAWLEAAALLGNDLPGGRERGEVVYFPAPSLSPRRSSR